jgi:hypothetical protein
MKRKIGNQNNGAEKNQIDYMVPVLQNRVVYNENMPFYQDLSSSHNYISYYETYSQRILQRKGCC